MKVVEGGSELNVNVDDIVDEQALVPPGIYQAVVASIDFATDKSTGERKEDKNGDEFLTADFRLTEGDHTDRHVFVNYLHPRKGAFKKLCAAAGVRGLVSNTEQLIGLPVKVRVENELYQGDMKAKVGGFI